jgi:hypothetical protein
MSSEYSLDIFKVARPDCRLIKAARASTVCELIITPGVRIVSL